MHRTYVCLVTALLSLGLVGCTSSAPSSVDPPESRAPEKKAFVAPEWDSTEFRNKDDAFFMHYPKDFEKEPLQGPGAVLSVASPSLVPRVDVNTVTGLEGVTMELVATGIESSMAQVGGGEATVTMQERVTLRDGVTEAMRFNLDWSFQGFPLNSVVLVTPAADYHVNVMVTGMDGADLQELEDIAFTLTIP